MKPSSARPTWPSILNPARPGSQPRVCITLRFIGEDLPQQASVGGDMCGCQEGRGLTRPGGGREGAIAGAVWRARKEMPPTQGGGHSDRHTHIKGGEHACLEETSTRVHFRKLISSFRGYLGGTSLSQVLLTHVASFRSYNGRGDWGTTTPLMGNQAQRGPPGSHS